MKSDRTRSISGTQMWKCKVHGYTEHLFDNRGKICKKCMGEKHSKIIKKAREKYKNEGR